MATQRVIIDGNEYTKSIVEGTLRTSTDYRVVRVNETTGKRTSGHLNPTVHRRMIARIEAALQSK